MKNLILAAALALICATPVLADEPAKKVGLLHKVAYNATHFVLVLPVRIYTNMEIMFYGTVQEVFNEVDEALDYHK